MGDQTRAPLVDALQQYRDSGQMTFAPPGHRQGLGVDADALEILGRSLFADDVLVSAGLDPEGDAKPLERAEELMAEAVGAQKTFFFTCGSSLSVKSAMMATAGPGRELLVARNAHKSVVSGLLLGGMSPVWVHPRWDPVRHMSYPPGREETAEALREHPDAAGMLLITPTDYGTCADIAAVADECHKTDRVLIVDEAWGAHMPFHRGLPPWGMDADADVCITSVHKMGMAVEQSSVFHLQGDRVSASTLKECADLLSTTSPSTLIYASIDAWRRQMVLHGEELLGRAMEAAQSLRDLINSLDGMTAEGEELCGPRMADTYDPLKIVVDLSGLGVSGYTVHTWLYRRHGIDVGLADHRRITIQITQGDTEQRLDRLAEALRQLPQAAAAMPRTPVIDLPAPGELELETVMRPRDAFFGPTEDVPMEKAAGHIAAEIATPYPPGVPVIVPGEIITQPVVDYLRSGLAAGMRVPDALDPDLRTLRVVHDHRPR